MGWKVDSLIIIMAGARVATHTPSMDSIETTFKIPKLSIKYTFEEINIYHCHTMCYVHNSTQKDDRKQ